MTILSKEQIRHRLFDKDFNKRLIITPITDIQHQVSEGTIDIRLGTHFIIFKGRKIGLLDPANKKDFEKRLREFQEIVYTPYGDIFILHPNQFILGGSLEYMRFPPDLLGYVVGRSSWGRLGLIIETSPVIHPCFTGVLTFEFSNLSTAPIALRPGTRIAQVAIHRVEDGGKDCKEKFGESRYNLSTHPEFSRVHTDPELDEIAAFNKKDIQAKDSQIVIQQINSVFQNARNITESKTEISPESKKETLSYLDSLQEEMKKKEPDAGKIQKTWNWLKRNASWVIPVLTPIVLEVTRSLY
jgi:dCTP deaminase